MTTCSNSEDIVFMALFPLSINYISCPNLKPVFSSLQTEHTYTMVAMITLKSTLDDFYFAHVSQAGVAPEIFPQGTDPSDKGLKYY